MANLLEKFPPTGDKKNSDFFKDYLPKIYNRREASGLDDLIEGISAVIVQVDKQEAHKYLMELYLMTPYRFHKGYIGETHKIYILQNKPEYPKLIILEPLQANYFDKFTAVDSAYPRAEEKSNVRYIGEIYKTKDLNETVKTLESQEFRFQTKLQNSFLSNSKFRVSDLSYFTNNVVIYTETDIDNISDLGEEFMLTAEEKNQLDKVNEVHHKFLLHELVNGIDHLATRVFCGEREDAILELLCMTNYYFWGAYSIDEMNSSTNICRNPKIDDELKSPAKVFTANNTPFYTKTIDNLPSPTEDFVRNFGKRMHHIAYDVEDGARSDGTKNIDYVVAKLQDEQIPFLAQIIGECKDFPDLKQIFSKSSPYSFLITEYVQRCHGFEGFFTKNNVAYLTQAAGEDEKLRQGA